MNAFLLEKKTILVTGATSGIGKEIVLTIVKAGGLVIATGRNNDVLTELSNISANITTFQADLTKSEDILVLVEKCPALDGFVYSAGVVKSQPIRYLSKEKLNETFGINFFAPVELVSTLDKAKKINKKASFVFLSSIASEFPRKGGASYSASKIALEAFMKVMAMEYAHREIRANAIRPAMIKTPMYEEAKELAGHETMQAHISRYPLGIGETEDVANAVIYFLSDASKWTTGTTLTLDGGLLLGY